MSAHLLRRLRLLAVATLTVGLAAGGTLPAQVATGAELAPVATTTSRPARSTPAPVARSDVRTRARGRADAREERHHGRAATRRRARHRRVTHRRGPGRPAPGRAGSPPITPVGGQPLLGAVGTTEGPGALAAAGFSVVVVQATWQSIEPTEGSFSTPAIAALQSEIDADRAAGLQPSLDIGVQYAPSWVFGLGGGTQLVDQYGDTFAGAAGSGDDIANAVTDDAVRAQEGVYLDYLGQHVTGVTSVRVGGGPDDELRYPSGSDGSQPDAYWFYDPSSQATLPAELRGWTPGTGTAGQAASFLSAYDAALNGYGAWLVRSAEADFPVTVKVLVELPGWGQRPGEVGAAATALLTNTPDEVNQGLDWTDLLPLIGGDSRVVAYSTYADASQGSTTNPDPAAYIHQILPPGMLEGGESTGNGQTTLGGEALMFSDAKLWGWYDVAWFFAGQTETDTSVAAAFRATP